MISGGLFRSAVEEQPFVPLHQGTCRDDWTMRRRLRADCAGDHTGRQRWKFEMAADDVAHNELFMLHASSEDARLAACRRFVDVERFLRQLLPRADIRHVGATAIATCLTKGDLDVVVRVAALEFGDAYDVLAKAFKVNEGSVRTENFAAFEDATASPQLGIQLTAMGGPFDVFHIFAETLLSDGRLVAAYNNLKRAYDGRPMAAYRAAKDRFIADVLAANKDWMKGLVDDRRRTGYSRFGEHMDAGEQGR
jgi:GrpB-like predicted nucleotidyltransferase (UPF0157 family)